MSGGRSSKIKTSHPERIAATPLASGSARAYAETENPRQTGTQCQGSHHVHYRAGRMPRTRRVVPSLQAVGRVLLARDNRCGSPAICAARSAE